PYEARSPHSTSIPTLSPVPLSNVTYLSGASRQASGHPQAPRPDGPQDQGGLDAHLSPSRGARPRRLGLSCARLAGRDESRAPPTLLRLAGPAARHPPRHGRLASHPCLEPRSG